MCSLRLLGQVLFSSVTARREVERADHATVCSCVRACVRVCVEFTEQKYTYTI